jgi:arsenate reductase
VKAIIYHNPRCSKSRQTLALLEERGVDVEVVEYLKDTPDAATLRGLMKALGKPPREVIRRGEAPFAELGLATRLDDDDALIVLLERPIVVVGKRAVIGRPPENVLVLFDPVQ